MKKASSEANQVVPQCKESSILKYSLQPVVSTFSYTLNKIRDKRSNRIKPRTNIVHVTEIDSPQPVVSNLKVLILIHNSLFRLCVSINQMYNRLILLLLIDHFVALIYKLYFPTYVIIVTKTYDSVLLFHSIYWILIRIGLLFVLIYMFYQTQYEVCGSSSFLFSLKFRLPERNQYLDTIYLTQEN